MNAEARACLTFSLILLAGSTSYTSGATCEWTGATDTDWANPLNWSGCNGTKPQPSDDVLIPQTANAPSVGTDESVADLQIDEGTLVVQGSLATVTATLDGTLRGRGSWSNSGLLKWAGGVMRGPGVTEAQGGIEMSTSSARVLEARRLRIGGASVLSGTGSSLSLESGAVLENLTNGTLRIQNDSSICCHGTIANSGTLVRESSSGEVVIGTRVDSEGEILISTGTLTLEGGGTLTGSIKFEGTTLRFASYNSRLFHVGASLIGTTMEVGLSAQLRLAGSIDVAHTVLFGGGFWRPVLRLEPGASVTSLGHDVTVTGTGELDFASGGRISIPQLALNVFSATVTGPDDIEISESLEGGADYVGTGKLTILPGATATVSGRIGRTLENGGDADVAVTIESGGLFRNLATGSVTLIGGIASGGPGSRFENAGEFKHDTANHMAVEVDFVNTGIVTLSNGSSTFFRNFLQTAGEMRLLTGYIFPNDGAFRFDGGTLLGYDSSISGTVLVTGSTRVVPGNPTGLLNATPNYVQSGTALLDLELNGTAPGEYDLFGSESANIGGSSLRATLGFSPAAGDFFSIFAAGSFLGRFGTLDLPPLPAGLQWQPNYYGGGLFLRVQELLSAGPLRVDQRAVSGTLSNANGVLDPGETVLVETSWKNPTSNPLSLGGSAEQINGPPPQSQYSIVKGTATYGTITPGAAVNCFDSASDCYQVRVANPASRPTAHWHVNLAEHVGGVNRASWLLHIGGSFEDVPANDPYYRSVENVFHNGITRGCGGDKYCPAEVVTRAQMSIFLLKSKLGSGFVPPRATGQMFSDVPADAFAAAYIEEMARAEITTGCGGGKFCPSDPVTRAQMAIFLLRTSHGPGYSPPPASGTVFVDVPADSFGAKWIEQLALEGITGGCGGGSFCPNTQVARAPMSTFLVRTFHLQLYEP
jgi:hypothetical protein